MDKFPQFKDAKLTERFKKNGYLVLPFLSEEECDLLIDYYNNKVEATKAEFSTTMNASDTSKKAEISSMLCKKVEVRLEELIDGFIPLFANFLVKKANITHKVGLHQDWTYVNESKFRSFNVWVALCDTGRDNGGLNVLPKSHLLPLPIRYTPFPDNLKSFESIIRWKSKLVKAQKGYAVIYDSALIHFSNANKTNKIRPAFGCVCIPKTATPLHYYKENNQLTAYKVDHNFFNSFVPGEKPNTAIEAQTLIKKGNWFNLFFKLVTL